MKKLTLLYLSIAFITATAVQRPTIYFITGNEKKLLEMQSLIPDVRQVAYKRIGKKCIAPFVGATSKTCYVPIDLTEIQETDGEVVITAKMKEAFERAKDASDPLTNTTGPFIIEDTSLYLDAFTQTDPKDKEHLSGIPGPLIKWFGDVELSWDGKKQTVGNENLYKIAQAFRNFGATAQSIIAYGTGANDIRFFKGTVRGKIVSPRQSGAEAFGWDPIFEPEGQPEGQAKTFAEMSMEEKNKYSMRGDAARKLLAAIKPAQKEL